MAVNNQAIVNAAIAGFYQGTQFGRSGGPDASATTANAAAAFATEVDSKIPVDAGMDAAKANLCQAICASAISGAYPQDATAADYSTLATNIAATYTEGATKLG